MYIYNPNDTASIWGFVVIMAIIIGVLGLIFWGKRQTAQHREAMRLHAQASGWEYGGEEPEQVAGGSRFQIVYSFSGTSNSVPWVMVYSTKVYPKTSIEIGSSNRSSSHNQFSDRLDWRSDAVSIPNMVFLKVKQPSFVNQLASMVNIDANTYVGNIFNLGLTEADTFRIHTPFLVTLLSKSSPFGNKDYGLKQVMSFEHPGFEAHSVSEEAAAQVMNAKAIAALDAWNQSLEARHGTNASLHYLYQPTILFHEGGVFVTFDTEQSKPEDLDAIVELGTALVNSQR